MRREKLQTVVSLAEIISAVAVVVTLLYAATEFRRSRILTSTDVQTILYERMLEMDRLVVEADGLAGVLVRAAEGPETLTTEDSVRFVAYEHVFYDSWELAWAAHHGGVLEQSAWTDWDSWFRRDARRRPSLGWEGNRSNYNSEFIQYVDPHLARED
jgi:hypothetical protein